MSEERARLPAVETETGFILREEVRRTSVAEASIAIRREGSDVVLRANNGFSAWLFRLGPAEAERLAALLVALLVAAAKDQGVG